MKRLETWRGYDEEKIKSLSFEQYAKLLSSRNRRALLRVLNKNTNEPYRKLIETVKKHKSVTPIRTHIRDAVILNTWIGKTFDVHNGKEWKRVEITLDKLDHRLGDYSYTTKPVKHSGAGVGATRGSRFVPLK
jgi:small subunit ribosomal protein S19